MKSTRETNNQLQKALQKSQIDVLDVVDDAFDKAKAQVLFLHPELNVSRMNFFKVVVVSASWIWKKSSLLLLMILPRKTILMTPISELLMRIRMKNNLVSIPVLLGIPWDMFCNVFKNVALFSFFFCTRIML